MRLSSLEQAPSVNPTPTEEMKRPEAKTRERAMRAVLHFEGQPVHSPGVRRAASFTTLLGGACLTAFLALACTSEREKRASVPTYQDGVESLLRARCAPCHAGATPPGGWWADSYVGAVGCTASGRSAVSDGSDAPLLAALMRADHEGVVTPEERDVLATWIASGAPNMRGGVHASSFADPRSPESHGRWLRASRYRPMFDDADVDACGRCHDGAPARPEGVTFPAPGATACTSCHAEPGGPLACSTCHGMPGKSYPPRERCFFPDDPEDRAHAKHAGPSASRAEGLPCSTCHPTPEHGQFDGTHANGYVEIWFDRAVAGREARFDATTKTCTGTCHARGGARPAPTWVDAPMRCGDCHGSPPPDHYAGSCTSCHREANDAGTSLSMPTLHVNGKVDLGDGSGRCGACHGRGDDPWPATGAHDAHAVPENARAAACETCHVVPGPASVHPEGRGFAAVRFAGLATRGARRPSWEASSKTCAGTYCHEGAGGALQAPRWTDGESARACGACHSAPPPPPHSQSAACASSGCHVGSTTSAGSITSAGKAVHVDGVIDRVVP